VTVTAHKLEDARLPLWEWKKIVEELILEHGDAAIMATDAGPNNVTFEITGSKSKSETWTDRVCGKKGCTNTPVCQGYVGNLIVISCRLHSVELRNVTTLRPLKGTGK
jgi:hypothetical protein